MIGGSLASVRTRALTITQLRIPSMTGCYGAIRVFSPLIGRIEFRRIDQRHERLARHRCTVGKLCLLPIENLLALILRIDRVLMVLATSLMAVYSRQIFDPFIVFAVVVFVCDLTQLLTKTKTFQLVYCKFVLAQKM